ncbi:hypothetical protein BJX76DRAFT_363196 [Aspergillus varians]
MPTTAAPAAISGGGPKAKKKQQAISVDKTKNDETVMALETNFLGTILMDIRLLDLNWPEQQKNRTISSLQVKNLILTFVRGIRRFAVETRLKATISEELFQHILQHILERKIAKGKISVTLKSLQDQALQHVIEKVNTVKNKIGRDGEKIKEPAFKDYLWAVNLYSAEKCKGDILMALCANAQSIALANLEGYSAYWILTEYNTAIKERQLAIVKDFALWAQNTHGLRANSSARVLQVTKLRLWR